MNWELIKNQLLVVLKGELIKKLLVSLIGKTVGFQAWIISFVANRLWDSVAVPIIEWGIRKGKVVVHKKEKRIVVRRMKDAQNESDFDDAFRDL